MKLDPDVRHEFEVVEQRIDRVEGRVASAVKLFLTIILPIALAVGGTSIVVYAQVNQNTTKNTDQQEEIVKLNGTRDKVLQLEPRLEAIEKSVSHIIQEQEIQRSILEDIRREVKK